MIRILCSFTVLFVLTANSVYSLWVPKEDMLQFPTDEEVLQTVENLKNGKRDASSPLAELAQVEENHADVTNLLIKTDKRELKLKLKPSYGLIRPSTKIYIQKDGKMNERSVDPEVHLSHYHGEIEGTEGSVGLARTKNGWRGMIMTDEGNLMLHDIPENTDGEHLVMKMRQTRDTSGTDDSGSAVDVGHDSIPQPKEDFAAMEDILNHMNDLDKEKKPKLEFDIPIDKPDRSSSSKRSVDRESTQDKEYELEVAVYIDKDLYDYIQLRYPNDDPVERLKTNVHLILNMVHARYQSNMIKDRINVVLMRFTIYTENPPELKPNSDVVKYLHNFCVYEATINVYGEHYDLGILLTGKDLHMANDKSIAGGTYTGGMCRHDLRASCLISEAHGFLSAFAIAHEIGHSFNMSHDSVDNACKHTYLMGPYIDKGVVGFSKCSKDELRNEMILLDDFGHNCLREPATAADSREVILGLFPGLNLEKNAQCIFLFGKGAKDIIQHKNYCSSLTCLLPSGKTKSLGYPPIDGSKCAGKKMCYFTKCVNAQKKIQNIQKKKTKPSGLSGEPLTPDELCEKYADKNYYYVTAQEMNYYIKSYNWPPMCRFAMLCRKDNSFRFLDMPPRDGTPCNAEETKFCSGLECV